MKKIVLLKVLVLILTGIIFLPGCATILGGSRHKVHIKQGTPTSARVYLNGEYMGEAPESVKVQKSARQGNSYVEIKAEGYETAKINLTRKVSVGFVIMDLCCAIIPLAIDFATGNIYKPRPHRIDYYLEVREGYNAGKIYDIKAGDFVIFSYGRYKFQEGEIIAVYPDRALIKTRKPKTLIDKVTKKIELNEEEIEVPLKNIARK